MTRLAVDLQQTCEPTGLSLWAQVRLNSTVPVRSPHLSPAAADLVVPGGSAFILDGLASGSWFDPWPSYQWRQTGGAAVSISQPGSRVTTAVATPLAAGQAVSTLELEVADALARRSIDSVNVTVLGADQPFREVDVARIRTIDSLEVERMRHDVNKAYFETAAGGLRERIVQSYSRHIFGLSIRANVEDQIPTGNMKVIAGTASDFNVLSTQVELLEIDEFNSLRRCTAPDGVMRVADAAFAAGGFTRLAVDFDLRCPDGWTYRGVTRFDSAIPIESGRVFAYAGPDRVEGENSNLTLDGTASLIVQAPVRDYRWRQLSGPQVSLTTASPGIANFTVPQLNSNTDLTFELEVTGDQGERGTDTVTIHGEDLTPPPPPPPPPPAGDGGGGGGGGSIPLWLLAVLSLMRAASTRFRGPVTSV